MTPGMIDPSKNPTWTLLQTALTYNVAFVELAFDIGYAALERTQRLLGANSASELNDAMINNMRDQFEALSEQVEELSMFVPPETEDTKLSFWD